jgi:NADH:ubiquinone oxidoreductase subunit E
MPIIRVWEVVTFYTMYNTKPFGEHRVHVCTTTPCWLRGSDDITAACERKLGITFGETTEDGKFSLHEIECGGACVNAPLVQINDDYYEDLDADSIEAVLDTLMRGEAPTVGSQTGRLGAAPASGPKTLLASGGDD